MSTSSTESIFSPDGALARSRGEFEYRAGQQQMAAAVADAFENRRHLVIEAGTGVGKSLAYLIPALTASEPVILSTGTKALQDQLLERELPIARKATGSQRSVVVLKGRGNYLCKKRLDEADSRLLLESAGEVPIFKQIRAWAGETKSGDRAEIASLPDRSPLWAKLDGRAEICTGQACSFYEECHVFEARRAAERAQVIVVNHHLLFADLALRRGGHGRILPPVPYLVLDEAHLAEDAAVHHFGTRVSLRMFIDLARDAARELERCGRDADPTVRLERVARDLFARIRPTQGRIRFDPRSLGESQSLVSVVDEALHRLQDAAGGAGKRSEERGLIVSRSELLREALDDLMGPERDDRVLTVEPQGHHGAALSALPLDTGKILSDSMASQFDTVIATSATMSIDRSLDRAVRRLGLDGADKRMVRSPFREEEQACLYLPNEFPEPRDPKFFERSMRETEQLLDMTQGRALLLFASHHAMERAAQHLVGALPWTVMVQGEAPRERLIERFRDDESSVLLGTASFRQGIDIPGPALSLVVVDKLPFAVPDDPLVAARSALVRKRGGEPFMDESLPEAILSLRQALGRLVRRKSDRGILSLLDVRVRSKRYGQAVLASLPPWPVFSDLEQVRAWHRAGGPTYH